MLALRMKTTAAATGLTAVMLLMALTSPARSQTLVATPDTFTVFPGQALVIEFPGVLENDTVNDQGAGDVGAVAELVADALFGALSLNLDGSFTYTVGAAFDGRDEFTYRMTYGGGSAQASVILSACTQGPGVITCWSQTEFYQRAQDLGLDGFHEGFEDDAVWGGARTPFAVPAVTNHGLTWTSNHPDAPASNNISTTTGPPHSGLYAGFDPDHGYATGTPLDCDVNNPPQHCLYNDGLTATVTLGSPPLHGVGAWIDGTYGAKVQISLDGGALVGGIRTTFQNEFIGVIDPGPTGFNSFRIVETDGKIGQALFIFLDDITVLTRPVSAVSEQQETTRVSFAGARPNPLSNNTTLSFSLAAEDFVRLTIYDQRGRLIRTLLRGFQNPGDYAVNWDGRDNAGQRNATGLYFGRLEVGQGARQIVRVKKMVLLR